jgi:hypothetical protein
MMNFLEASHYKLANSFAKLDGQQKLEHKFGQYIEITRDKQVENLSSIFFVAGVRDSSEILPGLLLHGNTWLSKLLNVTVVIVCVY